MTASSGNFKLLKDPINWLTVNVGYSCKWLLGRQLRGSKRSLQESRQVGGGGKGEMKEGGNSEFR